MNSEFQLAKLSSFSIKDPEMISKYASLGYFHFQYVNTLDSMNQCDNIVKDNGVVRGTQGNLKEGSYITISVVDFTKKRKTCCLFWFEKHRLRLTVGDLLDMLGYIYDSLKVNESSCFVKFDSYTLVS